MAPSNTLTVIDNRTATKYDVPIENGTIRALDLRKIRTGPDDFGLMTYDPAFMNTASCRSSITFIDGERGILRYRGYPIEMLAEHCSFLEVAYLLLFGDLPTPDESEKLGQLRSPITPCCLKPRRSSWKAFTTMPIPWPCW